MRKSHFLRPLTSRPEVKAMKVSSCLCITAHIFIIGWLNVTSVWTPWSLPGILTYLAWCEHDFWSSALTDSLWSWWVKSKSSLTMTSLKDRFINIAAFNNDSKSSLVNFFFLYSLISRITNLFWGPLQSVQHTILNPFKEKVPWNANQIN